MNTDKLTAIKNAVTSKAALNVLRTQKHSPAIMFGAGVVTMIGTVVLSSRATMKLDAVLDEHDQINVNIDDAVGNELRGGGFYTPEDADSDKRKNYVKTAVAIGKLYGPALACGVVSVGLLTGAHVTLSKRNAGLVAAYGTVQKALSEYRERVVDDQGAEKDHEYMYGTDTKQVYSEGKKGEPIVTDQKIYGGASGFGRLFNESNKNYNQDASTNLFFLRCVSKWANERLQARGYVFLNEVYSELGFDWTPEGQVVGWVKGNSKGANFIDFGIYEDEMGDRLLDFMTGREGELLLTFNVDPGTIHNSI